MDKETAKEIFELKSKMVSIQRQNEEKLKFNFDNNFAKALKKFLKEKPNLMGSNNNLLL